MIHVDQWLLFGFIAFMIAMMGLFCLLGAWVGFRVRTVGTGYKLFPREDKQAPEGRTDSYVSDLYDQGGMEDIYKTLTGENLSEAARKIRGQKGGQPWMNMNSPMADVMAEVEGKKAGE